MKWKKKTPDHDYSKCITTQEFNKLMLAEVSLADKDDIDDFVEMTDFDDILTNWNKTVTSNKTKQAEAERY